MATRNYFVAVNGYRSSSDNGFANTWGVCRCIDRRQQRRVLTEGLPVSDSCYVDNDGRRSPVYSKKGVRAVTAAERREALREIKLYGWDAVPDVLA